MVKKQSSHQYARQPDQSFPYSKQSWHYHHDHALPQTQFLYNQQLNAQLSTLSPAKALNHFWQHWLILRGRYKYRHPFRPL